METKKNNELLNKKKRLLVLTFLATFLFAKKGVPFFTHLIYLSIIMVLVLKVFNFIK